MTLYETETRAANALVEEARELFAGKSPEVQGAAIAQLLAIFIAGHAPELRAVSRNLLIEVIDNLVPVIVEQMIEDGRAPEWWREGPH